MSGPGGAGGTAGEAVMDAVLLRRFGWVRAVGGAAYLLAAIALGAVFGLRVWPLALGVTVLVVATTAFFRSTDRAPRSAVVVTLVADVAVIAGTAAFVGGSGSGLLGWYAIVLVSAGTLLGTGAALGFTGLVAAASLAQLTAEQLGLEPALLYRPALEDRLPVFLISVAGLGSVGYLSATYAGRLHELIGEAGVAAEGVRLRGARRRRYVRGAADAVRAPLGDVAAVAAALAAEGRDGAAARLRTAVTRLEAEVGQLADLGSIDGVGEQRPRPLALPGVVEAAVAALGSRLDGYDVDIDVGPLVVLGDVGAARRVVFNLLENVVEHTPPGTRVTVSARAHAGSGVLVVADDGPGIDAARRATLFDPPPEGAAVGLPLVGELCAAMGAEVRVEQPGSGRGTRVLVAFRLAPRAAPVG